MNYKYKRNQIFGKILPVPSYILKKVYASELSLSDYIKYELDDKIPISCIKESERKIVEKFGIEKCKKLDLELIKILDNYRNNIDIKELLMSIDSKTEDINNELYKLVKDKISPYEYSSKMKEKHSNRLFEITENGSDALQFFKESFNRGQTSLIELIKNWDLFKYKDVSYCLLNDKKNKDNITDKDLKEFMSNYNDLAKIIMDNNNIYTVIKTISNLSTEEEKKEYMKQMTDDILEKSLKETNKYDYNLGLSNKEYAEIFKYSSIKDYLTLINDGYPPTELIEEIQRLPINYIANMSISFSELNNFGVRRFIEKYGLKNIADFDNECGHFFTKNNCEMLKLMNEMYLHYGTFETRSNTDRPYTKDEFYEAMRRMIINGPTNYEYRNKAPDYRDMTGEFRKRNQDLFISEEAPEELQTLFYTKSLTPHNIKRIIETNPDCIKYLTDKDLSDCFERKWIRVKKENNYYNEKNIYSFLQSKAPTKDVIEFISEYRDILDIIKELEKEYDYKPNLEIDDNFEEIRKKIGEALKEYLIRGERSTVDKTIHIPDQIKKEYPDIFLPDNVSEGMKSYWDDFINGNKIDNMMYSKSKYSEMDDILNLFDNVPNWAKDTLKQMDLEVLFHYYPIYVTETDETKNELFPKKMEQMNLVKYLKSKFQDEAINIMIEYGSYLYDITKNHSKNLNITLDMDDDKNKVLNKLDKLVLKEIINSGIKYGDAISEHFKKNNPTLFLSETTPYEIRKKFYNREFTLEDFNKNPDLIEIFEKTNIICGFSEKLSWMIPLFENSENLKITNYNRLKVIFTYSKIQDINHQNAFKHFIENHFDNININNIEEYGYILQNIKNYNDIEKYLSNIKEKNKDILIKDIIEIFNYSNSSWITKSIQVDERISYMDILKIISLYEEIDDSNLQYLFKDYVTKLGNDINMKKIEYVSEVLSRLSLSNSSEIIAFRKELATQILNTDDPLKSLDKIEDIFIKNNIPTVGKIYSCFEILHPNFQGFNLENSMVSPILKKSSPKGKQAIVFSDLIKSSFGSNNKSVNDYLKNIEYGSKLYESIKSGNIQYDSLDETSKKELIIFEQHLITLYNNTIKGKKESEVFTPTENIIEDISTLKYKLSPDGTLDYNVSDRIIRMFCGIAGIDTLEEAKGYINNKIKTADSRNRNAANTDMVLEKGDFVKGIRPRVNYNESALDACLRVLPKILKNGSNSKEFLGADAGSDATPLDTDVSMIMNSDGTIAEKMNATAASEYGPIWFVLKNDDRFITTRTSSETLDIKRDLSKLEVFYTGALGEGHYGIRTGFASSEINYIIMDNYDPRVGLEIAMNGFYIPVANKEGKIIFTPKDYEKIRMKMSGLSYFEEKNYTFSENLITEETEYLSKQIEKSNYETQVKREKINKIIQESLNELGLHLKTSIDGDLTEGFVELIDTGSTGRGTNKPGDGDFDFMMRLDKNIVSNSSKLNELKQTLLRKLGKEKSSELTGNGDFRLKNVKLDSDTSVDIDITFTEKTDKVSYSTDTALQDRLATIQRNNPEKYKYVAANILLAKQVLKKAEVYKPNRGEIPQGGLGGVGIENWILQNGGSFIDAAKSFVKVADGKIFSEFQSAYQIWDFGENHLATRRGVYPHDNFVTNNMSEEGYQKMVKALKEYLKTIELNQNQTTGIKR